MIDPLLTPACAFNDPFWIDFKGGEEDPFNIIGDAFDFMDRSIEVFKVVEHFFDPKVLALLRFSTR